MATSFEVASEEARRDFKRVRAFVCAKYARYDGYDPEEEVIEAMKSAQELALNRCPDEGRPRRADWFLKLWAEYLWALALRECAPDFGDDLDEPMPSGFGDGSKYRSFPASLAPSPEHEKKLEDKLIALEKVEREKAERALAKLMQEQAEAKAEAERQEAARQAELQRQRQEEERKRAEAEAEAKAKAERREAARQAELQRQREEEERRRAKQEKESFAFSRELAGVVKTRQQVSVGKQVQDLTSKTASSHKDAAPPLPALPLRPQQPSPTRLGLETPRHSGKKTERLVTGRAPPSGGANPNWSSQEIQKGDMAFKAANVIKRENLEAEARAAGFENSVHAHEAACLGIEDALFFYKYKNWPASAQEDFKRRNLWQFSTLLSVSEGSASQNDSPKEKRWADYSDDDDLEGLDVPEFTHQVGGLVDKGKGKAVLDSPEEKRGADYSDDDDLDDDDLEGLELPEFTHQVGGLVDKGKGKAVLELPPTPKNTLFKKSEFPPPGSNSKSVDEEDGPLSSIGGKVLKKKVTRTQVAPAAPVPPAPVVKAPTAAWAKKHADKHDARQELMIKEASVQAPKAQKAKKVVLPKNVQRLGRMADDEVIEQLWDAIKKKFPNFNEETRNPFEVQILKENFGLFFGSQKTELPNKIRELTVQATGMLPYSFYQGSWLIIGLYTWSGSGTDPARQDATRQLFKLMWDWAAAVGEKGKEAGTLFDKLDAFYTANPPVKPPVDVKRTWANKPSSSSKTKRSKDWAGKLTPEQKELVDQVQAEVLSLFEDSKCSDKRTKGLDTIIGSRLSSIRDVGLVAVNMADYMADCVVTAYPSDTKEHSEVARWLTAFGT